MVEGATRVRHENIACDKCGQVLMRMSQPVSSSAELMLVLLRCKKCGGVGGMIYDDKDPNVVHAIAGSLPPKDNIVGV